MRFSIITPSFRNSRWLQLCVDSVADQGVDLEHIVQDAGSDDGTLGWLLRDTKVKTFVEKDQGMYDAINRGFQKASGEILAYLNCDEQYLPGALACVREFFQRNPEVEVAFADAVVINPKGEFLCYRKALLPRKAHCMVSNNLSILTCATFFRRSVMETRRLFFNASLRCLGDADWTIRCIDQKVQMGLIKEFTSVFTDTGENMSLKADAQRERKELFNSAPWWAKAIKPLIVAHHRCRKLFAAGYHQKPFNYSIYVSNRSKERISFNVRNPTGRWTPYVAQPVINRFNLL